MRLYWRLPYKKTFKNTDWNIYNLDKISYASSQIDIEQIKNLNRYSLLKVDLSDFENTQIALKVQSDLLYISCRNTCRQIYNNSMPF